MPRVIEQGAGQVFLRPLGHNQTTGHTVAEFVHPFFSQFIIFNLCFASRTSRGSVSTLQAKTGETSPVPPSSRASDLWIGNVRYGRLLAFERTLSQLSDCRLFSAFLDEAKVLKLRKAAIGN